MSGGLRITARGENLRRSEQLTCIRHSYPRGSSAPRKCLRCDHWDQTGIAPTQDMPVLTTASAASTATSGLPVVTEQPARRQPETKHERFVRMVETRMHKIIEAFDEFCKLADREYYEATDQNKQQVLEELRRQVDRVEQSFKLGRKTSAFKLE